MKRNTFVVLVCAAIAAFVACGGETHSPTRPNLTIVRIDITGPSSVAPGASAQFTATGRQADGASRDLTAEVQWASSNRNILTVSNGGTVSGVALGDARVFASFTSVNANKEVVVVPQGTFRIVGLVTEADAQASPVPGATVSISGGPGDGLSTTTAEDGRYRLFGVGGDVRIRITKDGYDPFEQPYQALDHATVNAQLRLSRPRVDRSGTYSLTITAADDCRAAMPVALQVRSYTAIVAMTGSQIDVRLEGANFALNKSGFGSRFRGRSEPNGLFFTLSPYEPYSYFYYNGPYGDLVEDLTDSTFLVVSGRISTVESASGFTGTLDGAMTVYIGTLSYFPKIEAQCKSSNHRIVFRR